MGAAGMKDPTLISLKSATTFQSSSWEALGEAIQDFLEEAGRTLSPSLVDPEIKTIVSSPVLMQTQTASNSIWL